MKENLYIGDDARTRVIAGADKVANAVKGTLGAAGYNGLIETFEQPFHVITNDGISIARSIQLQDPVENIGANLMKEIAQRSDKQSGDGTTTAITIAQAIIHGGLQQTESSPMEIKKSLEECVPIIEAAIKDQTKDITVDDVGKVATVSAEDENIGALIQEIYQKIGKDGILYPDVSKTFDDHYTLGTGVKIEDAGFASPYMADADDKGTFQVAAQMKNVRVLITKQKITSPADLEDLFQTLYKSNVREMVIFCDEFEAPVIPALVMTRASRGFRTVLIKLPVLWKDEWFDDLARMTGATVIDGIGVTLKTATADHVGSVGSIVVNKNDTYLDGIKDMSDYISTLGLSDTDESKIRIARLNTKTARLFVGAPTDAALSYKRLKVEDARNAAWQSLHGGIVAGGGVCLRNIADKMPDTVGGNIMRVALRVPFRQIMTNAGIDAKNVPELTPTGGFDARTLDFKDMFDAGIVDPANTVLSSVRNAISVAATVLTAHVVVTLNKTNDGAPNMPIL